MVYLHQFLEMMGRERRSTRSTLSAYEADLHNFYEFLKNQKVESASPQDIQAYLFTQKHLSSSTVARRISSLRQFYSFLLKKGKMSKNPLTLMEGMSHKPSPSPFLGKEDVERLLAGAKAWNGAEGKRLSALVHILYETNMSVHELVSLPLKVAQNEDLSTAAQKALDEYLKIRKYFLTKGKESPWLFPSLSKKGHLTRQRFGQLLKKLAIKVELASEHISLSRIRGSFKHFNSL